MKPKLYTIGLHDSSIAAFKVAGKFPPYHPTVVYQCLLPMEEFVNEIFNRLYESLPKRQRSFVEEHIPPGGGANGFAWADSLTTQLVHSGFLSILFMGTLANNPTDSEDGEYILNEYQEKCGGSALELKENYSLDVVVQLEGPFAFIIHDQSHGRVLAARDADGVQPLFWATCPRTESLLFASDKALFLDDCEKIEEFPRGAVFISKDWSVEGTTATFGSKVLLHPELCRVESANNIAKLMKKTPSLNHIQL